MARCSVQNQYLPATATAGLSFSACVSLADYPAPEWELVANLRGPTQINLEADADGATHRFSAAVATTAQWAAGEYWYSLRASRDGELVEIETGTLRVLPDLAAVTTPYDGRTQNQIALDAINAVLAKRATLDQERYRINNRELYRTPIAELLKLRAHYVQLVQQETGRKTGRKGWGRQVAVRFKG